ncbi:TetR/AcrR family transcriptional regulator [Actinophytocola xinjiangensis]|uniref:TetR/AcrR family transcriptional regulator n=1 Tax=Actinophytocola xinjiangensis TaxID=485602 RepID=UPI001FE381FB|nr:TetR/AcrR family transcriptional regulator [Actinophytocola xinjiangensis]
MDDRDADDRTDEVTGPRKRGPGRPRDPGTDRAILHAAFELFLEGGVEGTSMERIARRAGVGKLTVYRRWSSKEELLAQAVETVVEEEQWPSNEDIETGSPADIVDQVLPASAELAASERFRALVARIYGSAVSHPALMAAYWRHYLLPRREATKELLRHAQQEGTVAADADLDVLIDMMAGAVTYRVLRPDPPGPEEMRRYLETLHRQVGLLS